MSFNDGGAYDFHSRYVELKEQMAQQIEVARESGHARDSRQPGQLLVGDLEQLPAYESVGAAVRESGLGHEQRPEDEMAEDTAVAVPTATTTEPLQPLESSDLPQSLPREPPPGYDEAVQSAVVGALEGQQTQGV